MKKRRDWVELWMFFALHFLVDFACIYFLVGMMVPVFGEHDKWLVLIVFYNSLAFGIPALLGLWADWWKRDYLLAAVGCFGVLLAFVLRGMPWLAVLFMGLGNGLFHIGGGKRIMDRANHRYTPSGIFISSGAVGVFLGNCLGGRYVPLFQIFPSVLLAGGMVLLLLFGREHAAAGGEVRLEGTDVRNCSEDESPVLQTKPYFHLCFGLLLLVVILRSYYGTILNYSWKQDFSTGCLFVLCVAGGKFFGGILADRWGYRVTAWLSLGLGGIFALFSFQTPICGYLSVGLFNMTMPLTLYQMGELFPKNHGFAFGILMFALYVGTLPGLLFHFAGGFSPAGLFGLCISSLIFMLMVDRLAS